MSKRYLNYLKYYINYFLYSSNKSPRTKIFIKCNLLPKHMPENVLGALKIQHLQLDGNNSTAYNFKFCIQSIFYGSFK